MHRYVTSTPRAHAAVVTLVFLGIAGCSADDTQTEQSSMQPPTPSSENRPSTAAPTTEARPTVADISSAPDSSAAPSPRPTLTESDSTAVETPSGSLPNPGSVDAGTYTLAALQPPVVIELGEDWWAGWDYGDNVAMPDGVVALEHRLTSGFVRLAFWDTTDLEIGNSQRPDIPTYVRELSKTAGLTERPTDVGGLPATRLDFGWTGDFAEIIRIPRAGYVLASDEPQHWVVLDTTDGQLLINWTVENASGADLELEAETLIGPILSSLQL